MVLVKNKLRQPLIVNVEGGKAIHFLGKQAKEVTNDEFNSAEMKNHVALGNIIVLRME